MEATHTLQDISAKTSEILHVVDIGASGGIHPRWHNLRQEVKAILFEPDPREYHRLKSSPKDNHIILNAALSDSSQESEFHLYRDQQASSVYLPDLEILRRYYSDSGQGRGVDMGKFEIVDTIKITMDTLDQQLNSAGLSDIDFIKIDVQGHELPILRGGANTLEGVVGVEVEVEFLPVYKKQPLFRDVDAFLQDAGFELFDIKRTYRTRRDKLAYGGRKGQLVWGDALYFRSPERLLADDNVPEGKIMRAINVYLAYNYPDVAGTLFCLARNEGLLPRKRAEQIEAWLAPYKVEQGDVLPNFKGRNWLHRSFSWLAHLFSKKYKSERQEDKHLGNPF